MPKASPIQTAFNAGELSPRLEGRVDLDKYKLGCRIMENFLPMVHGGAIKRSGTRFVKEVKDSADATILHAFEFSNEQAYILEFGDQYIRFYKDSGTLLEANQTITGITQANPAVVTITSHPFSNGDLVYIDSVAGMTEVNGKYYTVANAAANTFELSGIDSSGYTAYSSAGTAARVYEVATPWLSADLSSLRFTQSADVLYVAHESYAPRKISRTADTSWTVTEIDFVWPTFLSENIDESVTIYASAATGAGITLTASSATFTSDMVGGYIKLREITGSKHDLWNAGDTIGAGATRRYEGNVYKSTAGGTAGTRPPIHTTGTESDGGVTDWEYLHSGEGYAEIVGFTSTTAVTADVVKRLPDSVVGAGNPTFRWSESAWSDKNGYPRAVTFYEDRLLWAGSTASPQTIWGSVSGDYENYQTGVNDDDSFAYTINTDTVNVIEWLSPGKVLLIGTVGGEFVMSASSLEEPITPTNVRIARQTTYGSKEKVPVINASHAVLFVQRAGLKVRELTYNFDNDAYQAPDLTILSEHITAPGITGIAYQQEPNSLIWCLRSDGILIALTYERTEGVFGWHRHPIAGTGAIVESIASIPHPDGDADQLWLIVKRTINGATKRYVEYMEKTWVATNDQEDSFFVDSGLTYDGAAVSSVSGLDHLEGATVTILADGATHSNKTVSSGSVTLDRSASVVHVGYGYNATLQTMRFEAGAADGTSQGKTKRITNITARLYQTGAGLWFGPNTTDMEEVDFRDPTMAMDAAVPLFDGDKGPNEWPEGYEQDARVTAQHRLPLPCTVLALMPQIVTQDR